MNVIRKVVF